jgi:hypothetical protein
MRSPTWKAVVGLAILLSAFPAGAQEAQPVQLHGFGSWAYGNTDANAYLSGLPDGNYREALFALHVSASVSERLRIVSQMDLEDTEEGSSIDLDYAFAEWRFSDRITLRAGKVKQPFGISTEVFDVGTLRPFLALPQAVYGPVGLTAEAFQGVGFTGSVPLVHSWRLSYDVYGGGMVLEEFQDPEAFLTGEPLLGFRREATRDVIGGRIVVETPVAGLTFGGSAYIGHEVGSNRRWVAGVQAEYLTDKWLVRTEYAHESVKDDLTVDGFYAEVAYRIDPRWQVAGQYGRLTSDLPTVAVTAGQSLLGHEERALGLNYWFSPAFVCKLAYHHVDGNRFAAPDSGDLAALVSSGRLRTKTNLVEFGVQFSF